MSSLLYYFSEESRIAIEKRNEKDEDGADGAAVKYFTELLAEALGVKDE